MQWTLRVARIGRPPLIKTPCRKPQRLKPLWANNHVHYNEYIRYVQLD